MAKANEKPSAGHNSTAQLKSVVQRIERLEEEKKTISDDIRDVYAEAKGNGFDVKALRTIVRMRKQDANERDEQEVVLEIYMAALGMLGGTPLGDAALRRDVVGSQVDLEEKIAETLQSEGVASSAPNTADVSDPPFRHAEDR